MSRRWFSSIPMALLLGPLLIPLAARAADFGITSADALGVGDVLCTASNGNPNSLVAISRRDTMTIRVWGDWIENTRSVGDSSRSIDSTLVRRSARNGLMHSDTGRNRQGKGRVDVRLSGLNSISQEQIRLVLRDRFSSRRDSLQLQVVKRANIRSARAPQSNALGQSFDEFTVTLRGERFRGLQPASDSPTNALQVVATPVVSSSRPQILADGTRHDRNQLGGGITGVVTEFRDDELVARFRLRQPINRSEFDVQVWQIPCRERPTGFVAPDNRRVDPVRVVAAGQLLPDRAVVRDITQVIPSGTAQVGDSVTVTLALTRPLRRSDRSVVLAPGANLLQLQNRGQAASASNRGQRVGGQDSTRLRGDRILWQLSGNVFSALPGTPYSASGTLNGMNEVQVSTGQDRKDVRFHIDRCPTGVRPGDPFTVELRAVMHDALATAEPLMKRKALRFLCPER